MLGAEPLTAVVLLVDLTALPSVSTRAINLLAPFGRWVTRDVADLARTGVRLLNPFDPESWQDGTAGGARSEAVSRPPELAGTLDIDDESRGLRQQDRHT